MVYYIIVACFAVIANFVGLALMYVDKKKAIKKKWRIPESVLFGVAAFLGGIGSLAGMYIFRHKTKHKSFIIGIPILTIISYGILIFAILLAEGAIG